MFEFKDMPETDGYRINKEGVVLDPDGRKLPTYLNGDGYVGVSIKKHKDVTAKTYGVHRLVLLTFDPPPESETSLTVNHIDRDKRNNDYENLEWLTARENNIHAFIVKVRVSKICSILYRRICPLAVPERSWFTEKKTDALKSLKVQLHL
jgi:hypothetical protein